jgi:two-component system sensor histidine kinase SenX3
VATADGEGAFVVLLLDDTTEARRVDEVRRDFVANVSHELKTPVGAMSLLAEAIQGSGDDPVSVRRFADRMLVESGRLSRLVQELIDLSRLQGAEPMRAASHVPVRTFVDEAVDRTRLAAAASEITVVVSVESDDLTVPGDERQLATAVANLLDNAIAYSPTHTRVAVTARRRDESVEVSVTDQGIGIAPADCERVFERFYRVDPARSRETGGTGLGLAIVKHIAGNHGGRVEVWSVEGTGSTFTLLLPAGAAVPSNVREAVPT